MVLWNFQAFSIPFFRFNSPRVFHGMFEQSPWKVKKALNKLVSLLFPTNFIHHSNFLNFSDLSLLRTIKPERLGVSVKTSTFLIALQACSIWNNLGRRAQSGNVMSSLSPKYLVPSFTKKLLICSNFTYRPCSKHKCIYFTSNHGISSKVNKIIINKKVIKEKQIPNLQNNGRSQNRIDAKYSTVDIASPQKTKNSIYLDNSFNYILKVAIEWFRVT